MLLDTWVSYEHRGTQSEHVSPREKEEQHLVRDSANISNPDTVGNVLFSIICEA